MTLFRYSLTGAVATAVHYLVLLALVEGAGSPAGPAAGAGAICGAVVAYLGNRRYAFVTSRTTHGHAVPRFFLVSAVGAAMNALLVWAGTGPLRLHYLTAQVIATVVILLLTYRLNRSWTFA